VATIRDVARAAGVSIATVSRVFNGSSRVSESTEGRVWEAARDLDYWPHGGARSLTTSRTDALGVLLPDMYGEFFSEVIRGIDQAARREGYQVLISSSHADADGVITASRSMRGRIDGMMMMCSDEASAEASVEVARRFPLVLLNPRRPFDGCSSISIANYEGAYGVVSHLVRLGHREVAVVTGPDGNGDSDERVRGYRRALADAGIDPLPGLRVAGDFTESSGYRAATVLLRHDPRPTAVFCANDSMAIGLLSALGNAGLDVPRDLAVAGFDDIAIARYLRPPLTTVHVDAFELGERAVRLLVSSIRLPDSGVVSHETLPVTFVVRQSCGSPQPPRETTFGVHPEVGENLRPAGSANSPTRRRRQP
jgi:LacI family transcriptional regulator